MNKRPPGRPRDPDKLAKRVMVNFHPAEYPALKAKAKGQGKSVSDYCREIINLSVPASTQKES
jgi:predicted HicB family RNase H-like nuclease